MIDPRFHQNAADMADIKNLELKSRDWLSNQATMRKPSVIARDLILIIGLFSILVIPKQSLASYEVFS